jgi:hypothetical protein
MDMECLSSQMESSMMDNGKTMSDMVLVLKSSLMDLHSKALT